MDKLYRLVGTVIAIGNAVAFLVGIDITTLGTIGTILSDTGVRAGIITASILFAIGFSWPGLRWACTFPARRRAVAQAAATKRRRAAADRIIRELNSLVSILSTDWGLLRGRFHPSETYTLNRVLEDLENGALRGMDRDGSSTRAHVQALRILRHLQEKEILPRDCAAKDGPARVWNDELTRLSETIKWEGLEAGKALARKLPGWPPDPS